MTKKTLLKKLGEVYGDGWPVDYEEAVSNGNGDGLASFIYIELNETLTEKAVDLEDAERLMSRAAEQIQQIICKIQELAQ